MFGKHEAMVTTLHKIRSTAQDMFNRTSSKNHTTQMHAKTPMLRYLKADYFT